MKDRNLLATAPTIDAIREAVTRFYCGTSATLIPTGPDAWKAVNTATGQDMLGVRIVRKRGRFRFEML